MRVIIEVNEERVEDIKHLLHQNNFEYEIAEDQSPDVPQWQNDEVTKRWKEYEKNPESAMPWKESLARLKKKRI